MKTDLNDRFINKYLRNDFPPEKRISIYDTKIPGFCLIVQPTGAMTFQLRYKNAEGASRRFTLGKYNVQSFNAAKARKEAKSKHAEVLTGKDVQGLKRETRAKADRERRQTLKVFFEEKYRPYCLSHMKNGNHRAWLIDHYFVEAWPDRSLSAMNHWLITSWRKRKLQEGFSHGGVNRPVSALKAMLNRAVEWGVIESNPLASLKPLKEDAGVIRHLTPDEDIALRAALDERQDSQRTERDRYNEWLKERHKEPLPPLDNEYTDYLKPMVLLALNTGMRRGELFNLAIDDVKEDHIVVRDSGTKTGKSRIIPLTDEARHVLATWIHQTCPGSLIFASPVTGKRLDNINRSWQALIKLSGIQDFRFHDLRHTFASNLAMRGVDLYVIKELLGHGSIETTQRYAHLAPDYKTSAISKLNETPLANP